jgi:hypothetical protein
MYLVGAFKSIYKAYVFKHPDLNSNISKNALWVIDYENSTNINPTTKLSSPVKYKYRGINLRECHVFGW